MHDDRSMVEARLQRVVNEKIRPAVRSARVPLSVEAWEVPGEPVPVTDALAARGVPDATARVAGELGVLAFKQAFARWSDGEPDDAGALGRHATTALDELRAAAASLG